MLYEIMSNKYIIYTKDLMLKLCDFLKVKQVYGNSNGS